MESGKPNPPLFWGTLVLVVAVDLATKLIAAATLSPQHIPHEIIGNHLRLTLVYNPGAAFGLNLGVYSRWIFMALTAGALIILGRLYRATRQGDFLRTIALASFVVEQSGISSIGCVRRQAWWISSTLVSAIFAGQPSTSRTWPSASARFSSPGCYGERRGQQRPSLPPHPYRTIRRRASL